MSLTALIIEDEADFGEILALNLARAGFQTIVVREGEAGIDAARGRRPDIVVLDLMLPDVQGTEVIRRLKSDPTTRAIPIIMATARGEEIDRIVGFELGVDDYVVKPFSMRELVLRVNAVLRRGGAGVAADGEEPSYTAGRLLVDGPAHRVFVDAREVELTALEFRLLVALVSNRGRVMTREVLLERVWGIQADIETRTVDTMTKRLRDKLGAMGRHVETVRGVGYRFNEVPGVS
jgi:two-component system, OmpR family, phosphate regulon response regulator PhoB